MANYAPLVAKKPSSAPEASRGKSFGIFFSIILTALVVGGGAFAYQYFVTMPNQDDAVRQKEQEVNSANEQLTLTQKQLADLQKEKEDAAKKMLMYSNQVYNYSILYPADYTLSDNSDVDKHNLQLQSLTDSSKYIVLSIEKIDPNIIYDLAHNGTINVAGLLASKYNTDSICNGGVCIEPMTEVRFDKDGYTYSFKFYNATDITDQNLEILNSFQFNN